MGGDSRPAIAAPQVSPGRGPRAGGLGGAVPPSERPAPIQTPALSCTRRGLIQGDGPPSHGFLPPWQRWGEGSSSTQDQKEKCHVACWDSPRERGSDFEGDTAEGHPHFQRDPDTFPCTLLSTQPCNSRKLLGDREGCVCDRRGPCGASQLLGLQTCPLDLPFTDLLKAPSGLSCTNNTRQHKAVVHSNRPLSLSGLS